MRMIFKGGVLKGEISTPPSKSHTHRAFFLAALAKGHSTVTNALLSEDTKATLEMCRAMGAKIEIREDGSRGSCVEVDGGELHAPSAPLYAANSGTTMRLMTGLATMFDTPVTIDGDDSLRQRPMGALIDALGSKGIECKSNDGKAPVTVCGPNPGGDISINGSISSQFISSLLLTGPMLEKDSDIHIIGQLVSDPYLDLTMTMMEMAGAHSERKGNDFHVVGGTGYKGFDYRVSADFSSAAFGLVAGGLNGDGVTVTDLNLDDPQGDKLIVEILKQCGARVSVNGKNVTVSKGEHVKAMDIDMGKTPDLFPIVCILLSVADGTSKLYGAPQLRHKESDRIESTVAMLRALGADVQETDDGCIINGKPKLKGGIVRSYGDHRIMMSAAVASTVCEGPVTVENADCYGISYPNFPEDMERLGLIIERC